MAPARAKLVFLSFLVLVLLITGTLWFIFKDSPESMPSYAPDKAKPQAASKPPSQMESVQQPTAEVLSNRVVEYHIDTTLDPDSRVINGTQTLTWTHPGKKTVNELYFHLYPNAFASMDTTFMKESGGKLRNDTMPADGFGSMTLTSMKTADGLSLMHRIQYVQPDDGNTKDKTLIKVRLPRPVKAGESITLSMQFEVHLPKIFARMGIAGNFVMAGQWFPKIAVYEPVGTRGRTSEGWDLHQYHGNSEFYSDFGIYSVRIHVPKSYTVAATGFPVQTAQIKNGEKIYQFYADDVHDFAWAASPDFIVAEEPFSSAEVPGVRIKLYLDPAHKDLKERYFYAAKAALKYFSKWYGKYPYSTLSIVVPPEAGNGAGGMEYPTLITAFGAKDDSPGYDLERTVIHEIGHQYFYGMVASNEFEEAWLDEGFTSYAEDKLMEQEYGVIPNLPIQSSLIASPAPLTQDSWKYTSQNQYALNVYYRGKLVLKEMEALTGTQTMKKIMSTYAITYRFEHPNTADFQKVVEQVTRKSWQTFFDQYVYGSQMADFSVDEITVQKDKEAAQPRYDSLVKVSKKGGDLPQVPILFTFTDGHQIKKVWDVKNASTQFKLTYSSPLAWAMIDPGYTIVLENKHVNNYLKADMDHKVLLRWNVSITKLIETLLGSLSW
ncbi:M1 family metallopeptidase [Paenibacillus sp. XY044]|uniref:M1 family metallopeptidase n=1 Tax=Paenibacillus sp. XY044 TaxID=2026089 RepID=UPI000B98C42E|nr:M1 family metallopeptidase [Paenibacillus sp. XY044]OZB90006.1 EnpEP protein [Paenibacillus sp. XY044]